MFVFSGCLALLNHTHHLRPAKIILYANEGATLNQVHLLSQKEKHCRKYMQLISIQPEINQQKEY